MVLKRLLGFQLKFLVSWAHFILSYFATYIGAARRAGPFDVLREIQTCFLYIQIWVGAGEIREWGGKVGMVSKGRTHFNPLMPREKNFSDQAKIFSTASASEKRKMYFAFIFYFRALLIQR
jgi:hypothetical protein